MPIRPLLKYNQKEVLLQTIRRHLRALRARSLLDIGAGDGNLAIPVSKLVSNYVAIEQSPSRVLKLRKAGLTVLGRHFPFRMQRLFDLVLVSHAIPERLAAYPSFIRQAWGNIKPGGELLIITFKGAAQQVFKTKKDAARFAVLISILRTLGRPKIERITSLIHSKDPLILGEVLRQMTGRIPLGSHWPKRDTDKRGYSISMEHLVLAVRKPRLRSAEPSGK